MERGSERDVIREWKGGDLLGEKGDEGRAWR